MVTIKNATNSKAPKNLPPLNSQAVKGGLSLNFAKVEYQYR